MRCLVFVLLLTACTESHGIGDFDAGRRPDVPRFDAPSFDVPSFDVPAPPPPPRDAGPSPRDAGPSPRDTSPRPRDTAPRPRDANPVLDAGPFLDITSECVTLCERAEMCIEDTEIGSCIDGCIEIQAFVRGPVCERLAFNIFRCAQRVSCEELERAFDDGACQDAVQQFGENCGEL